MKFTRLPLFVLLILVGLVSLTACSKGGTQVKDLEFLFSCTTPSGDACENHYGSTDQGCAPVDEQSLEKCPESYLGNQAVGVCTVTLVPEISLEWVPYSVPPAIDPVGECENLLGGVWSDTYLP